MLFTLLVLGVCALCAIFLSSQKPPREEKIIAEFRAHRNAYETLQKMLLADDQVAAVYVEGGVETTTSGLPHRPEEVNFPEARYKDYVALLKQVGSNAAFRTAGQNPELACFGVWGAGWAGNTRHMWVYWAGRTPANQVADLNDYYQNPKRARNVFRHIEGDWYLRADW